MTHHVFRSPFHSILRSFSPTLQNHCPTTSWSDVRETGGVAASRLKSCIKKALSSCSRKAQFYVQQRCCHTELLVSPQTDFKNRVRKATGFPEDVIRLIDAYAASKSPEMQSFRRSLRLVSLCRKGALPDPYRSVLVASSAGPIGALVSTGALTWMANNTPQRIVMGTIAVAETGSRLGALRIRKLYLKHLTNAGIVTMAAMAMEFKTITATAFTAGISGITAGLSGYNEGQALYALSGTGLMRHVFRESCRGALIGTGVAVISGFAPLGGQLLVAEGAMVVALHLSSDFIIKLFPWASFPAETFSPALASARNSAAALTIINMVTKLATGSFIPAQIFVPTTVLIAGTMACRQVDRR